MRFSPLLASITIGYNYHKITYIVRFMLNTTFCIFLGTLRIVQTLRKKIIRHYEYRYKYYSSTYFMMKENQKQYKLIDS